MSGERVTTPTDHCEASFDIVLEDDASSGRLVHVPNPNGQDRVVDKLLDVLSSTTEVLAQNQVVLSNLGQAMEAGLKSTHQKEKKLQTFGTTEVNVLDSQSEALSEEFSIKRAAMRAVLCDLINDADFTTSGAALHDDLDALTGVLRTGFEQTRIALHNIPDTIGDALLRMNINEQRVEALSNYNDAQDRRMAELSEELGRKRAAVDSLEKAVQDTEYEIHLLKNRQMEKDRQIAEMSKRIRELEELQAADKRDAALKIAELETFVEEERSNVEALEELVGAKEEELAALSQKVKELEELQAAGNREIGELETIIEEERANVKALEELVEAKDQELTGLPQTSQHLMTLEEKNTDEKHGEQSGHARALKRAEVSAKSKPAPPSQSMGEEKKTIESEVRSFFMQEVQLGKELMAEEMYEEGVEHLSNAVVMCAQPGHALHFFQQILPSEQFELLLRALPAAKQRIGLKYPELSSAFEAADQANAACEGGVHAALAVDEKKKNKKSMKRARTEHRNKVAPSAVTDCCAVTCGRRRNKLSHFDWIKHRSGEVSLRGANGKYVSSDGAFVTCNRDEAGPLECFTVV